MSDVLHVSMNEQLASFQNCFGVVFRLLRERIKIRFVTARGRNISREPVLSGPELRSPGSDFVIGCSVLNMMFMQIISVTIFYIIDRMVCCE
jgi:hypothetical protein